MGEIEHRSRLLESLSAFDSVVLSEETLDTVVETVVSFALSTIPGPTGASVSLARNDRITTANANSDLVRALDAVQYEAASGPCVDAIRTGIRQHASGAQMLQERWPVFATAAVAGGINAMLSTPLEARGHSIGSLNLYSHCEDAFGDESQRVATVFTRHAGVVLVNAAQYADAESAKVNLLEALATRQVIGQAMGIIMARERCRSDDAFDVLRKVSQHTNVKVRDIAAEILRVAEPHAPK